MDIFVWYFCHLHRLLFTHLNTSENFCFHFLAHSYTAASQMTRPWMNVNGIQHNDMKRTWQKPKPFKPKLTILRSIFINYAQQSILEVCINRNITACAHQGNWQQEHNRNFHGMSPILSRKSLALLQYDTVETDCSHYLKWVWMPNLLCASNFPVLCTLCSVRQ